MLNIMLFVRELYLFKIDAFGEIDCFLLFDLLITYISLSIFLCCMYIYYHFNLDLSVNAFYSSIIIIIIIIDR